ncbi:MAG: glycosyltransferase family 2 protein [Clostridia bacterium]|nr:glycosyltransferase family 2 protein [Clostridia bacterium]
MNELISVIIPCYQNAGTIEKAVDSVLSQGKVPVEIVAVNDGSHDETGRILDTLAEREPRIRVRHKENGGVGSARNTGIDMAEGTWLFFLDGDDFLLPGAFECLMGAAHDSDEIDIVCAAYTIRHLSTGVEETHACADGDRQIVYESLIRGDSALNSMCARLYRTEMIRKNGIRVPEHVRVGEDVLFNLEAFRLARAWRMLPDVIYRYELGGDSAMMRAETGRYAASRPMIEGILAFNRANHLETALFRAVIDLYVRTLRAEFGRAGAAVKLGRREVGEMTMGVVPGALAAKTRLYYHALRLCPFSSILLP